MRPYGYEVDRATIRAHEATIIRDAADRLIDGESLRSITAMINESGARTPGGNSWKPNVLRRVLVSPRIAGRQTVKGGKTKKADWPPIIDELTHKRLVQLFEQSGRGRGGGAQTTRVYLLTGGLAVCGICGKPLIARPNNDGKRGYVCSSGNPYQGCGRIRINADLLENDVVERVLARLLRDDAKDKLKIAYDAVREEAAEAPTVLKTAEKRLAEIGVDYADGNIGATEMRAARDRLNERIRDARAKQKLGDMLDDVAALEADDLVAWWEGASLRQQRALLELLVSKVEVSPATKRGSKIFDPSRVKVHWRRW